MSGVRPGRKPNFLWQGLLILLPVAVLATVGLWALRQDRAAVAREARSRAETIAATVLAEFTAALQPITTTETERGPVTELPARLPSFKIARDNTLDQAWPLYWPPQPCPLPANLSQLLLP